MTARPAPRWDVVVAALPLAVIQAVFFLVPLAMTVVLTFQSTEMFQLVWVWDFSTWTEVFTNGHYWGVLGHTLVLSGGCVALCLLLGFPIAYTMVMRLGLAENHVKVLIIFAFLTDTVLKTYGWVIFLEESGPLNYVLGLMGLGPRAVDILYTPWATLLGMVYNFLPFTIFTLYLALLNIDRDVILAAYDAGASRLRAFVEVTLPLCRPGIWAGSVLVFVLSIGVFLPANVLGGGKSPTIAELIRKTFETRVDWPLGAALTVVVIAVAAAVVLTFTRLHGVKVRGT